MNTSTSSSGHKTVNALFSRNDDGWWQVQLDFAPGVFGFGPTVSRAVYRLVQRIQSVTGETFYYHPSTVFYQFDHWPPQHFKEQWVVTKRGYGRVRNCFGAP